MEQRRDTFTLAALMRWLVETTETYFHKEDILIKVADAMAAYELDTDEVIRPQTPVEQEKKEREFGEYLKEVTNG